MNVCLLSLELKLNAKEDTAKERIYYMYKEEIKNEDSEIAYGKMSKAVEENKLTITTKRLSWEFDLYQKFMCTDKNNNNKKTKSHPSPFIPVTFSLLLKNYYSFGFNIFRHPVCFNETKMKWSISMINIKTKVFLFKRY